VPDVRQSPRRESARQFTGTRPALKVMPRVTPHGPQARGYNNGSSVKDSTRTAKNGEARKHVPPSENPYREGDLERVDGGGPC
jgi:hypothetical protein